MHGIVPWLILSPGEDTVMNWELLVNHISMKRKRSPKEFTDAVLFLINQEYKTGEPLFVNGGSQLQ